MTYNIRLLDNLSFDEVEPLLEQYIIDTVNHFIRSDRGQAYLQRQQYEAGYWIDTFIDLGYHYADKTLAKMTKADAQLLMESVLPRKITLMNPRDADDTIPELVEFWIFLQETYQFRSAGAIVKYLQSIALEFPGWMNDPTKGGIAKSFMLQGMQAGYDMTTQEGMTAFQTEYNQRLKTDAPINPAIPIVPMVEPPSALKQVFDTLGVELPEAGQPVNPMSLMQQLLAAANTGESSWSEEEAATLHAQKITEAEPGTVLHDIQVLVDYIGADGVTVSGKRQHLPPKHLAELNSRLNQSIALDLKRPQQKSYANIHGLYLLLRASGLAEVLTQGKKSRLVLNPAIVGQWQQFNATERYCTLLEAWLVRGHEEILGEPRSSLLSEGDRCFQAWSRFAATPCTYKNYEAQHTLNYAPRLYNLALMQAFGLVKLTSLKPQSGKGWRIKRVEATPLGRALFKCLYTAYLEQEMLWQSEADFSRPLDELKPALSPYFPAWRQTLQLPQIGSQTGRFIFKVSLGKVWRRLAIAAEATLEDLSLLILHAVNFDNDHLHEFTYRDPSGRTRSVMHPMADGDRFTDEVTLGSLPLEVGSQMKYVFDFGDWWEFEIQVEAIEPEPAIPTTVQGEILARRGKAPEQYPDYEDENW
ncbi:MAG: plasmid pRiA4b ORF-3 family protein [Cyanobacteria bacterium P01_G01_bin.54]